MDYTIAGTRKDLGIEAWRKKLNEQYMWHGVYEVLLPNYIRSLATFDYDKGRFLNNDRKEIEVLAWRYLKNFTTIKAEYFESLPFGKYDVFIGEHNERCVLRVYQYNTSESPDAPIRKAIKLTGQFGESLIIHVIDETDSYNGITIHYKTLEAFKTCTGISLSKKVSHRDIKFLNKPLTELTEVLNEPAFK